MLDITRIMLSIIENPRAKKPYRDMLQYYRSLEMRHEAESIESLIATFSIHEHDNPPVDKQ